MDTTYPNKTASASQNAEFALLMLAVFFSPFETLRHPKFFFTVSDFFFGAAFIMRLFNGLPLLPLGSATYYWLLGFVMLNVGLLVSSLINGDPTEALIVFVQYLFAFICLPYALLGRTYEQAVLLLKCIMWAMIAMCAFGVAAYFLGFGRGLPGHFVIVTGGGRLTSLVTNPNGFAVIVAFTFPIIWFLRATREVSLLLVCCATALFGLSLVLASSNTGFFLVATAGVLFILGQGNIRTIMITGVIVALLATVTVLWGKDIFPATFQKRVLNAMLTGELSEAGTFSDRYDLMQEALRQAEDYVIIGMGTNQFRKVNEEGLAVHNTYLLLLNEGGFISLLGFLIILGSWLVVPLMSINQQQGYLRFVFTLSLVVTFAFVANSLTHVYARYMIVPLLLSVGIACSIGSRSNERSDTVFRF